MRALLYRPSLPPFPWLLMSAFTRWFSALFLYPLHIFSAIFPDFSSHTIFYHDSVWPSIYLLSCVFINLMVSSFIYLFIWAHVFIVSRCLLSTGTSCHYPKVQPFFSGSSCLSLPYL